MEPLRFTKHASVRCQQRAIRENTIPLILEYGHAAYGKNGSRVYSLNKRERLMLRADLGVSAFNAVEKQLGFVVVSNDSKVITVGHTFKRVRNK